VPVPLALVPQPPASDTNVASPANSGNGQFVLLLQDGTCLMGVFGETKAFPFEAVFGNIEIPMTSIRAVDFAVIVNGTKTHRVQFFNGDMLTGNVGHVPPMKFRTTYGELTVPMELVVRVSADATAITTAQKLPTPPAGGPVAQPIVADAPRPVPVPFDGPPGLIRPPRARIVPDAEVR
jgi:hypothetical protein